MAAKCRHLKQERSFSLCDWRVGSRDNLVIPAIERSVSTSKARDVLFFSRRGCNSQSRRPEACPGGRCLGALSALSQCEESGRAAMNRIRIHVLPSRGRLTPVSKTYEALSCAHTHRPCSQPRIDGYEFCIKHILEDRNAPYKQCSYVSNKNGRRCTVAAPKPDKKDGVSFCVEHARRNALALQAQMKKSNTGPTNESLLYQLSSYARGELGTQNQESSRSESSRILVDEDSCSDSDHEAVTVDQTWMGDLDSEADSLDSDQEDPLKHAGVYTAEEVTLIMREKLIRLQSLYIDQFKRLQHLLKEKKRNYLHSVKAEHESFGSSLLTGPEGLSPKERENLKKLKALRRYRKRYGVEALLHRQLKERRILATEGVSQQGHTTRSSQRCLAFVEDVRCSNPSLPMTRHCLSHICQDSNQVLFKMCAGSEEVPCNKPLPVSLSEEPCCPLHYRLPSPMYKSEPVLPAPEQMDVSPLELYLSAAELQPTENLPLEFSDDLDVVGDGMQCPPSPLLFDPSADMALKDISRTPIDILADDSERNSTSHSLLTSESLVRSIGQSQVQSPEESHTQMTDSVSNDAIMPTMSTANGNAERNSFS